MQLAWQGQLGDLVTACAWSPNGRTWVASSAAGEIIWSSGLNQITILQLATGRSIDRIAFSADGRWLAAGGQSGQLLIWHCDPGDLPPQLVGKIDINRWIEQLSWHPTKLQLAISYDDRVEVWEPTAIQPIATWIFTKSSVFDLAWHPNGESLAVAGYKGVQIWSPHDSELINQLAVATASLKIAWAEDGRYLAAGNLDRTLVLMDWQQPDDPWILQGCPGKIRQIHSIAGATLPSFAVASGTEIVLWTLTPDDPHWAGRILSGHQGLIELITTDPHDHRLLSGDADGYVCVWSAQGEIEQILTHFASGVSALGWHPHSKYLTIGSRSGDIEMWQVSA